MITLGSDNDNSSSNDDDDDNNDDNDNNDDANNNNDNDNDDDNKDNDNDNNNNDDDNDNDDNNIYVWESLTMCNSINCSIHCKMCVTGGHGRADFVDASYSISIDAYCKTVILKPWTITKETMRNT